MWWWWLCFTWLLRKHQCLLVINHRTDGFRSFPRDLIMRINALPKNTTASTWFRTRVAWLRDHCSTNWAITPATSGTEYILYMYVSFLYMTTILHLMVPLYLSSSTDIGDLNVWMAYPSGQARQSLWSLSGDQGFAWFNVKLDLYSATEFRVRTLKFYKTLYMPLNNVPGGVSQRRRSNLSWT